MQHGWESGADGATDGGWFSADGRWVWNGVAWQPVIPTTPASNGRRGFLAGVATSGRRGFLAGVSVGCLASAIVGALMVIGLPMVLVMALFAGGAPGAPPSEPSVDWSNFPSGTQERIDSLAEDMNCHGLEQELAAAEDDADGEGTPELTRYIEFQMEFTSCYGFNSQSPQPG